MMTWIVVAVRDPTVKSLDAIISIKLGVEDLGSPIDVPVDVKIYTEDESRKASGKPYKHVIGIPVE